MKLDCFLMMNFDLLLWKVMVPRILKTHGRIIMIVCTKLSSEFPMVMIPRMVILQSLLQRE